MVTSSTLVLLTHLFEHSPGKHGGEVVGGGGEEEPVTGEGSLPGHQGHVSQHSPGHEALDPGEHGLGVGGVYELLVLLAAQGGEGLYTRLPNLPEIVVDEVGKQLCSALHGIMRVP